MEKCGDCHRNHAECGYLSGGRSSLLLSFRQPDFSDFLLEKESMAITWNGNQCLLYCHVPYWTVDFPAVRFGLKMKTAMHPEKLPVAGLMVKRGTNEQ